MWLKANSHHTNRCWPTATETSIRFDILSSVCAAWIGHVHTGIEVVFYSQTRLLTSSQAVFERADMWYSSMNHYFELKTWNFQWVSWSTKLNDLFMIQTDPVLKFNSLTQQSTANNSSLKDLFALMVPWKIITFAQKVLYGEKKVLQIFQMFFALRRKGSLTC